MMRDLIRVRELISMMKISKQTLWRWVRTGKFPKPIRIGGSLFWRQEDLDAFFESKRAA